MIRYLFGRIPSIVLVLFLASIVAFLLPRLAPAAPTSCSPLLQQEWTGLYLPEMEKFRASAPYLLRCDIRHAKITPDPDLTCLFSFIRGSSPP